MMSYVNSPYIFMDKLNWNFLWVTFSFCGIPYPESWDLITLDNNYVIFYYKPYSGKNFDIEHSTVDKFGW